MKLMEKRRGELVLLLEKTAAAVERLYAGRKLHLHGKVSTPRRVATLLRGHAHKQKAADAQYKAWLHATRDLRAELRAAIIPTMFALRHSAAMSFGPASLEYRELGFKPRKPRTQSVQSKLLAVEKAAATRKARYTMGKKQRRAIKGVLAAPKAGP
jgi:hypothetical protein